MEGAVATGRRNTTRGVSEWSWLMNAKGTNTSNVDLPPAAFARHVDDGRRRELARALHTPQPRAAGISKRLDHMRVLLARYRAEAIALHARLVALELAGNDNVAPLRRALIESSVQIESIGRMLADSPMPAWHTDRSREDRRFARGTDQLDEWVDQPTIRRAR